MKYKISALFALILIFTLTSCNNNQQVKQSSAIINTNDTEILEEPGTVASVVDATYDSVVSVRANVDQISYSMGSGTLFSYNDELNLSYILTCYHVIDGATSFTVTLADQETTIDANLVGGDPTNDIAVLSILGTNYTYATISTSELDLGNQIVIIGNPLGTLPGSVTSGYVSYINRKVVSEDYRTMELIQTDASINSGNSGGAMFDMLGRLCGVVNAKYVDDGVEGLGFAIPINKAIDVVNSIFETAIYDDGNWTTKGYYIGSYEFAFVLSDISYSLFGGSYVAVTGLSNNTTTSGYNYLQLYDEIVSVSAELHDGTIIDINFTSANNLIQKLYNSNLSIGDKITINIIRNRTEKSLTFTITQFIPL